MQSFKRKLMVVASAFTMAVAVEAQAFSNLYVFGDSLSDNGNLKALDAAMPERFTNGPVAVEVVASALGLSLTPSYHLIPGAPHGNNYAIAGAKAVDEDGNEATPDINLPTQVNAFLQIHGGQAPAEALYIVLIGGNDIRAARAIRAEGILAEDDHDGEERGAARDAIEAAVTSQQAQIEKLIQAGARHILVANAPDIGAIPETDLVAAQVASQADARREVRQAGRLPQATTKLSATYNRILARKLARLEHRYRLPIADFDLFSFLGEQIDSAEDFGYTNTDEACIYIFSQGGAVNPACSDFPVASGFLFWDEIHPTTRAHQAAGIAIVESLLGD